MKDLLKYLGVFLVLIGVVILGIYAFQSMINNLLLVVAGLFLVGGLVLYIIFNRIFD
jgi:drug/metabolite transporter (DMT)-like permease